MRSAVSLMMSVYLSFLVVKVSFGKCVVWGGGEEGLGVLVGYCIL